MISRLLSAATGSVAIFLASASLAEDALTVHAEPRPLPEGAVTEDWPRFLGPRDDATSAETKLLKAWPAGGPAKVWEIEKGEGYAGPSISGNRLLMFHRIDDEERVECRNARTGELQWRHSYAIKYRDNFGYSNGPRANPVIDGDLVYTAGVTGIISCLALETGELLWSANLGKRYNTPQNFFGYGASPLVWNGQILLNTGGQGDEEGEPGVCVAAFDKKTGVETWTLEDKWGASYASPVIHEIHGKEVLFVFAGGQSRPPHGGLLAIDPATGNLLSRFPWRADKYESVNASTPVLLPGNRIFLSECYELGGVLLQYDEKFKPKPVWTERWFGMHWMTPIAHDGVIYGFAGRNEPDVEFKCAKVDDGSILWNDEMRWTEKVNGRDWVRGLFRGSLLAVEGRHLALGEHGTLAWLKLSPDGVETLQRHQLFLADQSWTLPILSRGLLYVNQNTRDRETGRSPRIVCYDLRGN